MASTAVKTQGTTISIGGSTFTQIDTFTTPSDTLTEIDITNMSTTDRKEFVAGLRDGGDFTFDYIVSGASGVESSGEIVACSISIGSGGPSVSFMGYIKSAPMKGSTDGIVTQSVTVRVTGSAG